MTYVPLNNEDEAKLANSTLSTQLMMGVYPTQKYVNKIKKNIQQKNMTSHIKF
jgi:hypothetical protein